MERTHFQWIAMSKGELLSGMYTHSDKAATETLCRRLRKPVRSEADAYGLCEIVTVGDRMVSCTIIDIELRRAV